VRARRILALGGLTAVIGACATAGRRPDAAAKVAPAEARPVEVAQVAPEPDDDLPAEAFVPKQFAGPQPGEPAPDLSQLTWYRGAPPAAGQPYVVFFWGTWCHPCKDALPTLMARTTERGLPIVAVSRDTAEGLDGFFARWAAPFPDRVAFECSPYPVHRAYEAWTVPRFVYVGGDGHVERVVYGTRDLSTL